jgi:hypothetical protein
MRKLLLHIIGSLLLLPVLLTSCQKKLNELYNDPDTTTESSVEGFFTQMLNNDRVRPSYWNVRTFIVMQPGVYAQTVGYINYGTAYQQNAGYTQDRWNDFYRPFTLANGHPATLSHYRQIEKLYNQITDTQQKAAAAVYLMAAKVVLCEQAAELVDMWGDIPFSEAGSIGTSGDVVMAKFDNAASVYDTLFSYLKEAAAYFAGAKLSAATQATFGRQDILLSGRLDKWQRFANSLRLRLLMRISFVSEEEARAEVLTMLSDPAQYPLADGAAGYTPATTDILLQPLTTYTDDLHLALTEAINQYAPDYLLNTLMKPVNDPRIPVLFDKYGWTSGDQFVPNTNYNAMPATMPAEQQLASLGRYAIVDSATFLYNNKLPGIVITAPEVNFLKAEAFERWGGGNAQTAYETAIRQSITFYYYLNSLNTTTRTPLTPPATAAVDSFLENSTIAYTGTANEKLAKIWTQKWAHYGFLQSVQSWSEYRRTKYPQLTFYASALPGYELPPARLVYPASETSYNTNYALVKDKDVRTARLFWDVK